MILLRGLCMLANSLLGDYCGQKGVFACFYLQIGIKKRMVISRQPIFR